MKDSILNTEDLEYRMWEEGLDYRGPEITGLQDAIYNQTVGNPVSLEEEVEINEKISGLGDVADRVESWLEIAVNHLENSVAGPYNESTERMISAGKQDYQRALDAFRKADATLGQVESEFSGHGVDIGNVSNDQWIQGRPDAADEDGSHAEPLSVNVYDALNHVKQEVGQGLAEIAREFPGESITITPSTSNHGYGDSESQQSV